MKITVLTGAGISAESGLGTFRDSGGLWERYKLEDVATPNAWRKDKRLVLDFYNQRRKQAKEAFPNLGHQALVKLQTHFSVNIITQNIDDLHERAGSKNVLHLHGEIFKAKYHELDQEYKVILDDIKIGDTNEKGEQLRPHVVWFGESVPEMENAINIVEQASLLIIVGTSLQVYPAANLIHYVQKDCEIILIDPCDLKVDIMCKHIKLLASEGLPKVVKDLIDTKKDR